MTRVPWWGNILVGLYLAFVTIVCVAALVQMWPHPTPTTVQPPKDPTAVAAPLDPAYLKARCLGNADCNRCEEVAHQLRTHYGIGDQQNDPECVKVFWIDVVMWNERRLLLIVILAGALGGIIASIRSFFWFVGIRQFAVQWIPLYLFAPLTSGLLGAMIYLVIRGGFFSGMSTISDTSPYTFAAVAALVGMFHRETAVKLREIFQIVFTKAESPDNNPVPTLARISPDPIPRAGGALTLEGTGFVDDSEVRLGGKAVKEKPELAGDKKMIVKVTEEDLAAFVTATAVEITVFNPTPGGGTSKPRRVGIA